MPREVLRRLVVGTCFTLFVLVMTVDACDTSQNTDSRGNNPGCPNPSYPFCVAGQCMQCNPYVYIDVCDCAANKVCNEDFSSPFVGSCQTPPKYGSSCSKDSDCVTTFTGGGSFSDLICLNGVCRQCNPSGAQATPYNCTNTAHGAERACISPGYWGVPTGTQASSASPSPSPSSTGGATTNSAPTRLW